MTEIGGVATIQTKECKSIESVGFVIPNVQVKIIDIDNGHTLGANQQGEICIKTPTAMIGYYKNPMATGNIFDNEGL